MTSILRHRKYLRAVMIPFYCGVACVQAAVFEVNLISDNSDELPGDGACDVSIFVPGNQCSFRAAIEEANTTGATDEIRFTNIPTVDDEAVIVLQADLPWITETLVIDGSSAPGWSPASPKPIVFVDGGHTWDGISFDGFSSHHSEIHNLGIVRIGGTAIFISSDSHSIWLEGNYVGYWPGFVGQAGSTSGITTHADGGVFGPRLVAGSMIGYANYIANNDYSGILLTAIADSCQVAGNHVFGNNRCRLSKACGPDDFYAGITVGGDYTRIGYVTDASNQIPLGNFVYNNHINGISLIRGDNNSISGNIVGMDATGTLSPNGSIGIRITDVSIDNARIGSLSGDPWNEGTPTSARRNLVVSDGLSSCIEILDGTGSTSIEGNDIGLNAQRDDSLGQCFEGIAINGAGTGIVVANNTIAGAASAEITVAATAGVSINNNIVGAVFDDSLSRYSPLPGSGEFSVALSGTPSIDLSHNTIVSANSGLSVAGPSDQAVIANNYFGVDRLGNEILTPLVGVSVSTTTGHVTIGAEYDSATIASKSGNLFAQAGLAKISLNPTSGSATIRGNQYTQGGIDIDMGAGPNDPGDGDTGVNNLQNYPETDSVTWNFNGGEPTLDVQAFMATGIFDGAYPIQMDVYVSSDLDHNRAKIWIASAFAAAPSAIVDINDIPDVGPGGRVYLMATDADGASSEMGPPTAFGDVLFADSFEFSD